VNVACIRQALNDIRTAIEAAFVAAEVKGQARCNSAAWH
jgi:hypothetical protein